MTKTILMQQLEGIENAKRINRDRVADFVLNDTLHFAELISIAFQTTSKIHIKAAWILELVCEQQLHLLIPHLNFFTENLKNVCHDSAIRPLSKICNFLAIAYTSKKDTDFKNFIHKNHINTIIETGFDWMIGNTKVATKAYTMNTLFLFGKKYDWVHQELKLLLEQQIPTESAAYKARGKITLALINKK